jgi:hypothetical protein
MSHATSQMRDLAERLIAYETTGNKSSGTNTPAAFPVCEKLHPHLASLMGNTGFRVLLARALVLAQAEHPPLRTVQVKADGALAEVDNIEARVDAKALAEGSIVLVAQLLGLLVAFIGENLTLGLVREVWPNLFTSNLKFASDDTHEKT